MANGLPERIRIAFVIDSFNSGEAGTEKQLLETIRRLDKTRFDPTLICLCATDWFQKRASPCEVCVLGYKGFVRWSFPSDVWRLCRILRQQRFDVVHTFFEESIFLVYLASLLTRSQSVLISSKRDVGLGNEAPWYHRLFRLSLPVVYRRFSAVLANGDTVKKYVSRVARLPASRIKVIHNGIELPAMFEEEPEIFREKAASLWIGIVANLRRVKRIDTFLRAIALLRDKHKVQDFQAVVLGEGPERESLSRLIDDLNLGAQVSLLGSVRNVTAYLQRIDVGVLCSEREGFSNAILEYMACSLPVIVTSVGGNTELVTEANGICVPPGEPDELAKALATLARDKSLRQSLGNASRRKIETEYSWEKTMTALESYYLELLGVKESVAGMARASNS